MIFSDDADRARFCLLLQYASETYGMIVHAFCLMGNHVHLLVQPREADLSSAMHVLGFRYAQYFNKKYKRRGHLYQGRFKSIIVQSGSYLMHLVRYIHLNPVRAGMVRHPEHYLWSSHRAYAGFAEYAWLTCDFIPASFGNDTNQGRTALLEYVCADDENSRDELEAIRKSVRCGAYGDRGFIEEFREEMPVEEESWELPDTDVLVSLDQLAEATCNGLSVTLSELRSASRLKRLVEARATLALLAKNLAVANTTTIARFLDRDPTSLGRLARKGQQDSTIQQNLREIRDVLLRD